jgi:hypothetical protein
LTKKLIADRIQINAAKNSYLSGNNYQSNLPVSLGQNSTVLEIAIKNRYLT